MSGSVYQRHANYYYWALDKKNHSGYEVRVWEDPWIPTTPARPARSIVHILHPNLRVSNLINGEKRSGMLDY